MIKRKAFLLFCLLPVFIFCARAAPPVSVVVRVEAEYRQDTQTVTRTYTKPEKMSALLTCLRLLAYKGQPQTDPQALAGSSCRIVVFLSDGNVHRYYLRADRYLSKDLTPWITIDQTQASKLYPLLEGMPADGHELAMP